MNGIGDAGLFGPACEIFECELFRHIFHERHFPSFKKACLRAHDAFDLPQLHFASPEAMLRKSNALGRRVVRAAGRLRCRNTSGVSDKGEGEKGDRFHR